jgi:WhiB family redox-sensing transcriptional regulator
MAASRGPALISATRIPHDPRRPEFEGAVEFGVTSGHALADAACASVDTELFFAADSDKNAIKQAKKVCAGCPVRATCLDEALEIGDQYGVRGGMTAKERRKLRAEAA